MTVIRRAPHEFKIACLEVRVCNEWLVVGFFQMIESIGRLIFPVKELFFLDQSNRGRHPFCNLNLTGYQGAFSV